MFTALRRVSARAQHRCVTLIQPWEVEGTGQITGVLFLALFAAVSFSSFQQSKEGNTQPSGIRDSDDSV